MEEDKAHNLYSKFAGIDAYARQKRGLGFSSSTVESGRYNDTLVRAPQSLTDSRANANRTQRRGSEEDDRQPSSSHKRHRESHEEDRHPQKRSRDRRHDEADRRRHEHRSREDRPARSERSPKRSPSRRRHSSRDRSADRGHNSRDRRGHSEVRRQEERRHDGDQRRDMHERDSRDRGRKEDGSKQLPPARRPEQLDFESLIPGYRNMSQMQRMKARTKLLLAKTSAKDSGAPQGGQWTRYVFNKDALLEEEGARPEQAFGNGASAVSFRVPAAQAGQQERLLSAQEAHEARHCLLLCLSGQAAIFGAPAKSAAQHDSREGNGWHAAGQDILGGGGGGGLGARAGLGARTGLGAAAPEMEEEDSFPAEDAAVTEAAAAVSADVVKAQQAGSWRERAAMLKQRRLGT